MTGKEKCTKLFSLELPDGSRFLIRIVGDIRNGVLFATLRAIHYLEVNGTSCSCSSFGEGRLWSTMLRARTNVGETLQLSSRTLEKKSEIEIHKETSEYTIFTIGKYEKTRNKSQVRISTRGAIERN